MTHQHKSILEKANAAIKAGDHEGFLSHCTDDTQWEFVGDKMLEGKEAVRQWMMTSYINPPEFVVENLIAEGDFLIAIGTISMTDEKGAKTRYQYCDVWQFREGKMAGLKAFVIKDL